nr:protein ALP1-like [Lolium perenne]
MDASSASSNTPPKIKNSYKWFPYFRDCIGAIDGTHVTAKVPRSMSAVFRGRKHYTSQNVLATVDFDMRFTYVLAAWEGSAHDVSILADNLLRPDGLKIPEGWGKDEFFEEVITFDEVETGHGMDAGDNEAWKEKRQEWADAMWEARGNTTI